LDRLLFPRHDSARHQAVEIGDNFLAGKANGGGVLPNTVLQHLGWLLGNAPLAEDLVAPPALHLGRKKHHPRVTLEAPLSVDTVAFFAGSSGGMRGRSREHGACRIQQPKLLLEPNVGSVAASCAHPISKTCVLHANKMPQGVLVMTKILV
jgi:hypothetical protein